MSLQQLVDYFNDGYALEHNAACRPLIVENGVVFGLCKSVRIGSVLLPIRNSLATGKIIGLLANVNITPNLRKTDRIKPRGNSLDNSLGQCAADESIIDFDRLARTVHLLNYLAQSQTGAQLFLNVDPRHIMGVEQDHGAYFAEIIHKFGLQTGNVTIGLTVNDQYANFLPALLNGLSNYQRHGYKLALNFDRYIPDKLANTLIHRASPDYVGISIQYFAAHHDNRPLEKLQQFNRLVKSINGSSIMYDIDDKRGNALAAWMGFDFVHGDYFEQAPITNVTACPLTQFGKHVANLALELPGKFSDCLYTDLTTPDSMRTAV